MRTAFLVALTAVTAAVASFARAGGAAEGSPYQFAVGGAERSADVFADRQVAFSAANGPTGTSGEFTSHRQLEPGAGPGPVATFTGDVTCLLVDSNRAVIGGVVRQSLFEESEGTMFFAAVEDNGNPASGAPPDRVSAYFLGLPVGSLTCEGAAPGLYPTLAPVESGDIRVHG